MAPHIERLIAETEWLKRLALRRSVNRRHREVEVARPEGVPSVADAAERFEAHRNVVNAVTSLEEPYRTVVLLRFWEDLPPRAIAERLGVPVETVRTRLKRAVARLRAQLDDDSGSRSAWALPLIALTGMQTEVAAASAAGGTAVTLY